MMTKEPVMVNKVNADIARSRILAPIKERHEDRNCPITLIDAITVLNVTSKPEVNT
jgi:hypothetical protein